MIFHAIPANEASHVTLWMLLECVVAVWMLTVLLLQAEKPSCLVAWWRRCWRLSTGMARARNTSRYVDSIKITVLPE